MSNSERNSLFEEILEAKELIENAIESNISCEEFLVETMDKTPQYIEKNVKYWKNAFENFQTAIKEITKILGPDLVSTGQIDFEEAMLELKTVKKEEFSKDRYEYINDDLKSEDKIPVTATMSKINTVHLTSPLFMPKSDSDSSQQTSKIEYVILEDVDIILEFFDKETYGKQSYFLSFFVFVL